MLENALIRAVRTGKLGFEDLKRVALSAMAEIAAAAIRSGIGAALGGGGQRWRASARCSAGLLGAAGHGRPAGRWRRARAYLVGERGPELFVPTASGRVEPAGAGGGRDDPDEHHDQRAGRRPSRRPWRDRAGRSRGR